MLQTILHGIGRYMAYLGWTPMPISMSLTGTEPELNRLTGLKRSWI